MTCVTLSLAKQGASCEKRLGSLVAYLIVGPNGMHDDDGSPLDRKVYMRPTYVQNLDSIRSS